MVVIDNSLSDPASRCLPVTPSDTETLPFDSRALLSNTNGRVKITTAGGDIAELVIYAGVPLPIRVNKVWATGTTAREIFALS